MRSSTQVLINKAVVRAGGFKQLGKAIGASPSSIYRWQRGLNQPQYKYLTKLAQIIKEQQDE